MDRKPIRLLHTSDLHLGNHGEKDRGYIDSVIYLAHQHAVDLLVIAGDLFDHNRVDEDLVQYAAACLQSAPCPVFAIAGNHDCLTPGSVYNRFECWRQYQNIHIFSGAEGELVDVPHLDVSVWGKSIDYDDRDVYPLEGMPRPQRNGRWHIAVAHGYFVRKNPPLFPSYRISEEEIEGLGWDYIALGHVPTFQRLCENPATYYCGSPSLTHTVALVEMTEEGGIAVTPCKIENETRF
jgi:DNA repair exonuclease SbcCD nuclease subunit